MLKKTFILLFCSGVWSLVNLSCATLQTTPSEWSSIKANGLCFRLHDNKNRLSYLEQTGKTTQLAAELEDQRRYHQYVMALFREHFDFCPVYFFYASQTPELQSGEPVLLNSRLEVDPAIALPEKCYILDYNVRNVGESSFSTERFFILDSGIEMKANTFTTERLKQEGDSLTVRKSAVLPLRADKSRLLPTDVQKLNKLLTEFNE